MYALKHICLFSRKIFRECFRFFWSGGIDSHLSAQLREGKSHYVTSSHRAAGVFKVTTESDVMYMLPLTIEIKLPLPFYFWRVE